MKGDGDGRKKVWSPINGEKHASNLLRLRDIWYTQRSEFSVVAERTFPRSAISWHEQLALADIKGALKGEQPFSPLRFTSSSWNKSYEDEKSHSYRNKMCIFIHTAQSFSRRKLNLWEFSCHCEWCVHVGEAYVNNFPSITFQSRKVPTCLSLTLSFTLWTETIQYKNFLSSDDKCLFAEIFRSNGASSIDLFKLISFHLMAEWVASKSAPHTLFLSLVKMEKGERRKRSRTAWKEESISGESLNGLKKFSPIPFYSPLSFCIESRYKLLKILLPLFFYLHYSVLMMLFRKFLLFSCSKDGEASN